MDLINKSKFGKGIKSNSWSPFVDFVQKLDPISQKSALYCKT